mmetsp:Transcript_113100/g.156115  ORF Transcript_113100/g.156115 Transcript_113100/m.156115 type:complete len:511 (-) Transcript_113100:282-1814(-)
MTPPQSGLAVPIGQSEDPQDVEGGTSSSMEANSVVVPPDIDLEAQVQPAAERKTSRGLASLPPSAGRSRLFTAGSHSDSETNSKERELSHETCISKHDDELPDLMERIAALGLTREYAAWSDDYKKWRKGGTKGARGEVTADSLQDKTTSPFLARYGEWEFRRTISFWVAVMFLEGSLLFTMTSFDANSKAALGNNFHPLTSWSVTPGGLCFIAGTYLMCIETVNLNKKQMTWWPFASKGSLKRRKALGITWWPYVASLNYFIGALVYFVPIVSSLFLEAFETPEILNVILVTVPYIIAGALFTIGGICECIDNRTFNSWPSTSAWWAALFNLVGGLFFFAAGMALVWDGWWCNTLFGIGSAVYSAGGVIMIIMWKDEQFGLTFLAALNHLKESGMECSRPAEKERRFSIRSLVFLLLSVVSAAASVLNFSMTLEQMIKEPRVFTCTRLYNQLLPFFILHLALVLQSAVIRMPKATPFHQLMIALRVMILTVATNTLVSLIRGMSGHGYD